MRSSDRLAFDLLNAKLVVWMPSDCSDEAIGALLGAEAVGHTIVVLLMGPVEIDEHSADRIANPLLLLCHPGVPRCSNFWGRLPWAHRSRCSLSPKQR